MDKRALVIQMTAAVILTGMLCIARPVNADTNDFEVFKLQPSKETTLFISGLIFQQAGNYFVSKLNGPDLNTLNKNDIPVFERFACNYYSKRLSYFSDNTKDAVSGLMLLTSLSLLKDVSKKNLKAFLTDVVMFIKSETLIVGLTKCAKGLSKRPRPYANNTDLSYEKRSSRNASLSFWSGHASLAFTTAVFTGYVYQNRHPGSRFIMPVWITGISFATATSILRVRSGNHFPTDVIVGAAVGSFIGWIIPRMHQEKNTSLSLTTNVAGTTNLGILYYY